MPPRQSEESAKAEIAIANLKERAARLEATVAALVRQIEVIEARLQMIEERAPGAGFRRV
jgi:chaperonin cofactor prefoldin